MKLKKLGASALAGTFLAAGAIALAGPAAATGCGGGGAGGFGGGSYCDSDYRPDGSYNHCESVYVLGFGGWNCYRVYPPAP